MNKAFIYLPGIIWCLLSANVITQQVQLVSLGIVTIMWSYFAVALNKPTQEEQKEKHERLENAIEHAGESGLTLSWYNEWYRGCHVFDTLTTMACLFSIVGLLKYLYPHTFIEYIPQQLNTQWVRLLDKVTDRNELFVNGLFGAHFYPFWGLAKIYAILDLFKNTKLLKPWKIQSGSTVIIQKVYTVYSDGVYKSSNCIQTVDTYPI